MSAIATAKTLHNSHSPTRFEESLNPSLNQLSNDTLMPLRDAARERFAELGFPRPRKEEAWKYLDMQALGRFAFQPDTDFTPIPTEDLITVEPQAQRLELPTTRAAIHALGENAPFQMLDEVILANPERLARLTQLARHQEDALSCLNFALADAPVSLELSGQQSAPIEILMRHDAARVSYPALYVEAKAGSESELFIRVEGHETPGQHYLQGLLYAHLEEGARLTVHLVNNANSRGFIFLNTQAQVQKDATFTLNSFTLGAENFRHRMDVKLLGETAEAHLNGLSVLRGKSRVHQHVRMDHTVPNCHSSQTFKAAVGGEAFSEFDGTIYVRPQAQQTDAQQLSRNLLLSGKAKAFARPWLQIDADDVKCSHGATVGQLDEQQVFYLKSRGIDAPTAKAMLTEGFCNEMVTRTNSASGAIDKYIRGRTRCALASMVKG